VLTPTAGNSVSGVIRFEQANNGILVTGVVAGLKENSVHGFHVHADGDITDSSGMHTGDHFNPFNVSHACPPSLRRHVGDMGNITADNSGFVTIQREFDLISLYGASSILGRAIIVHQNADDCVSQPSGE